jgi:hypothetical protein
MSLKNSSSPLESFTVTTSLLSTKTDSYHNSPNNNRTPSTLSSNFSMSFSTDVPSSNDSSNLSVNITQNYISSTNARNDSLTSSFNFHLSTSNTPIALTPTSSPLTTSDNLFTSLLTSLSSFKTSTLSTNIDPHSISSANNLTRFTLPLSFHSSTLSTETSDLFSLSENFLETSTVSFFKISSPYLFSQNSTGSQLNSILSTYTGDLSACLGNCSNRGSCVLNSLQQ